ncbi:MAG: phage Gp37/Gp68 family protein [Pseudomonadota bacterium]
MADHSAIEWTDATWNPVVGCSLASPGCTNCYAMPMARRIEAMQPGSHYAGTTKVVNGKPVWAGKVALAPEQILTQPLRWRRPRKIFVNSMGDLFHESVPDEWIDRVFAVMALCPQHTFQVLTKRSARMRAYLTTPFRVDRIFQASWPLGEGSPLTPQQYADRAHLGPPGRKDSVFNRWPLANVWLGVSTEDQRRADERRDDLAALAATGWNTFASYEPALGPIDWTGWDFLKWLIAGGESGPHARPSHPDWYRASRGFCAPRGIAFFFKQWGEWAIETPRAGGDLGADLRAGQVRHVCRDRENDGHFREGDRYMRRVGKARAGRLLDGVEHNGMPEVRT